MNLEKKLRAVSKGSSEPCHQQIQRIIASAIESGALAADTRLPPERQLAEICSVSRTTVRLALETLVHQGYVEKFVGRGIFSKLPPVQRVIGCALPRLDPYTKYQWSVLLAQSVVREVRARGYGEAVYLLGSEEDYGQIQRDAQSGRIHGLLSVDRLQGPMPSVPTVYGNMDTGRYRVIIDYAQMVDQSVRFLAAQGRRRIALFTYEYFAEARARTFAAYKKALAEHALPFRRAWVAEVEAFRADGDPEEMGREALLKMWKGKELPDAIVFTDDWHALGALRAIVQLGVKIPEDLRVTTHVNKGYALPFPCPVTALELDPHDIAHAMVDLLEAVWKNPRKKAKEARVAPALSENYRAELPNSAHP